MTDDKMLGSLLEVSRQGVLPLKMAYRSKTRVARSGIKEGGELVLEADLAASNALQSAWKVAFPDIPLIDEESRDTHVTLSAHDGAKYGLCDPLDGSGIYEIDSVAPSFVASAAWGTTLGMMIDGRCTAGVMHQPGHRILYFGRSGSPCQVLYGEAYDRFLLDGNSDDATSIRSRRVAEGDPSALVLSIPGSSKMNSSSMLRFFSVHSALLSTNIYGNAISMGCAVGNCASVIAGQCAAYINVGGGLDWDLAVPFFLGELAGCSSATLTGEKIVWNGSKQQVILARNASTRDRLLQAVNNYLQPNSAS